MRHHPIGLRHTTAVTELPDHHRDPFDRMLIAQAVVDDLTLITRDTAFVHYDVTVHWR
jgi:PIN domain nuclease of toxin-antitoxin system